MGLGRGRAPPGAAERSTSSGPETRGTGKGGAEMAHDVIPLGAVPSGESAAQVGESGYAEVAFLQCTRYIALLRHTVGPEPVGARLGIHRAEADVATSRDA